MQVLFISNGPLHGAMTQLFISLLGCIEMFSPTQRSGLLLLDRPHLGLCFCGWKFHLMLRMFEGETTWSVVLSSCCVLFLHLAWSQVLINDPA